MQYETCPRCRKGRMVPMMMSVACDLACEKPPAARPATHEGFFIEKPLTIAGIARIQTNILSGKSRFAVEMMGGSRQVNRFRTPPGAIDRFLHGCVSYPVRVVQNGSLYAVIDVLDGADDWPADQLGTLEFYRDVP